MNEEFYVVKRQKRPHPETGLPVREWVIRLGGSTHTIEKYDKKREAIERAAEVARNRDKIGVIIADKHGDYLRTWINEEASIFRNTLKRSTIGGED